METPVEKPFPREKFETMNLDQKLMWLFHEVQKCAHIENIVIQRLIKLEEQAGDRMLLPKE